MARFFLDLEFTNGNYYLADIIEIALLSEISGFTFHTYVKIDKCLPPVVRKLTGITDKMLLDNGLLFPIAFRKMVEFIREELMDNDKDESLIIVAHGGVQHDFPIQLANCARYNIDDSFLHQCQFIDSMVKLSENGYRWPGLDTFRRFGDKKHSAYNDVQVLNFLCQVNYRLIYHHLRK